MFLRNSGRKIATHFSWNCSKVVIGKSKTGLRKWGLTTQLREQRRARHDACGLSLRDKRCKSVCSPPFITWRQSKNNHLTICCAAQCRASRKLSKL
ncbi:hypothetical protein FHT28_004078 [Rhizobium sp. SG570]|nr:hypothetical protein [Rhizobium sp. SG570]